jgi:hypothetical protein|tara:strand:+ start:104 stop:337 length:234 start_codon:yes stop_codon:yes gene_type:complete
MLEKLKDLEQEAMDNLEPETYMAITSNVMGKYEQEIFLAGYIDGLQAAIRTVSEESEDISYTLEMDDIFDDEDLNTN